MVARFVRSLVFVTVAVVFSFNYISIASAKTSDCEVPEISRPIWDQFQDINTDPEFRAGSIPIWDGENLGHGFLAYYGGEVKLFTAEHVARLAQKNCLGVWIPGTDIKGNLAWDKFDLLGTGRDRVAVYTFKQTTLDALQVYIDEEEIKPFKIIDAESVEEGIEVRIPRAETGKWTVYSLDHISTDKLLISSNNGKKGILCQGRSGQPLVINRSGRNRVIGVISAAPESEAFETEEGYCSYTIIAIPIPLSD